MSPPQVNLSEKKTPVDDNGEMKDVPLEKSHVLDGFDFNAVVVSETELRAQHHRHGHDQCRRKRNRCICGTIFVIIIAVAAAVTIPMVLRWRHRHHRHHEKFRCGNGHDQLHVDIDHDNRLIHAKQDHEGKIHILHAYDRKITAYKNEEHNVCYIDRLDETFEEGLMRWKSYKRHSRDNKNLEVISEKPIEVEVLEHICDVHIYELCHNSKSMWVKEIEAKEITQEMKIIKV